ncbi:Hypothetical protein PBC10988_3000 [Planctomycetales bacterium 10988]|nr:Hypothetical protein PBC10988_3000 [Planctomycetales bacterium 10988]
MTSVAVAGSLPPLLLNLGVVMISAVDISPTLLSVVAKRSPKVISIRASAEAIPVHGGGYDIVLANHMLYHAPDIDAALREFTRVLLPSGHLVIAAHDRLSCHELSDWHRQAYEKCGLNPVAPYSDRFSLANASMVERHFDDVQVLRRERFSELSNARPLPKFYLSGPIDLVARHERPI